MSDAWGGSWGVSWGVSWGASVAIDTHDGWKKKHHKKYREAQDQRRADIREAFEPTRSKEAHVIPAPTQEAEAEDDMALIFFLL